MLKNRYKKSDDCRKPYSFSMTLRDWRLALNSTPAYHNISNGHIRFQTKFVALITALGLIVLLYTYHEYDGNMSILNDAVDKIAYNDTYPITPPKLVANGIEYKIGIVADLDTNSKLGDEDMWRSYLLKGSLIYNGKAETVSVHWDASPTVMKSAYSLSGRGMELSELTVFNGRLLTFDDRTGLIYEIKNDNVKPWVILTDGDGNVNKGFKSEWATVKDNQLYVGSMGKEWTTSKGVYMNHNPMWVKIVQKNGEIRHVDWIDKYKKLRKTMDIEFPGYMIHESGVWSSVHRKWFFLPRRSSQSAYDETEDERKGTNILLMTDEFFNDVTVQHIGNAIPIRGFSSFKFIPSTYDRVIAALKTEEFNGTLATYITVFTVGGNVLLPETKVSDMKYEGLEFI